MVTLYDYLGRGSSQYILDPPPPSKSHHQNYETFLVGNPKRKTVLVTGILGGWGGGSSNQYLPISSGPRDFFPHRIEAIFQSTELLQSLPLSEEEIRQKVEIWASGGPPKFPFSNRMCFHHFGR